MKIYWTVSRASDRYEIWVDSKIHAENLTMDQLFAMWRQLHGIWPKPLWGKHLRQKTARFFDVTTYGATTYDK